MRLYIRKTDISPMYNGEVYASVYKRLISRRYTTARYMRLYITKTSISPMYNGEIGASEVIKISRQVGASAYKKD